jgi:hypothetical protein
MLTGYILIINGEIVEFLAYFPEKGEAEEIAAYSKASNK